MGVYHGGLEISVSQEFLDGANVVSRFHQVGGEAVAQGMNRGSLGYTRFSQGGVKRLLQGGGINVKAAYHSRIGIGGKSPGWKEPKPTPL